MENKPLLATEVHEVHDRPQSMGQRRAELHDSQPNNDTEDLEADLVEDHLLQHGQIASIYEDEEPRLCVTAGAATTESSYTSMRSSATSVLANPGNSIQLPSLQGKPAGWRKTRKTGLAKIKNATSIEILYDAELEVDTDCKCCECCAIIDPRRSYLYIRENSIEMNIATSTLGCDARDNIDIRYFDRDPFGKSNCCCADEPKVEVQTNGCQCCWMVCCRHSTEVIIVPYERLGCLSNRIGWCTNCCGIYGKITGNAIIYERLKLQPKNKRKFVQIINERALSIVDRRRPRECCMPLGRNISRVYRAILPEEHKRYSILVKLFIVYLAVLGLYWFITCSNNGINDNLCFIPYP